ncbi:MAG: hypothetical protein ACKO4A_06315 [Gammaproteobacteria bacterium]
MRASGHRARIGLYLAPVLLSAWTALADDGAAAPPETGEQTPAEAGAGAPEPTEEQRRYIRAVEDLEAEGGAYDAALAQQLLGLGVAYQSAGQHTEAAETLSRAAHITRVNNGFYSPSDLPILERLIESYAAIGEWDGVGSSYQQMFQIHRRSFGDGDERLLPSLQRLSSWHLKAYLNDIGEEPINHLQTARNLYDSSLGILKAAGDSASERLEETLRERAIVDYYLAAYVPPSASGFSFNSGPGMSEQGVASFALAGFTSGREALEEVLALRRQDPGASPLARGEAIAELGDWHQLFNRRQTAADLYREAFTEASADATPDAANSLFGKPIALPVLPKGLEEIAETESSDPGLPASITVAFAVNERGLAEDIRVLESQPEAAPVYVDKLRKRLRGTRFRPRFEAGEAVPTPDLTYRYRYTP